MPWCANDGISSGGWIMTKQRRTPVAAILAAEIAIVVVGGSVALWIAQDIVIKALKFVVLGEVG
jgi:hypothetical protein